MRSGFGSLRAAVLAGALLASACSPATTDASATATTPTAATNPTSTTNATPTPTPSPTGSALGPVGTIAFQDGKVWLVTPEGDYTMNIPQGYEGKEPTPESTRPPHISPIAGNDSQITYFCLPEGGTLPEENELLQEFAYKMVDSSHIREDLNNFAGHPAVALQVQTLIPEETIIYLYTQIGKRVWVMNFAAASQEQADDLIRQASESLTKQ